MDPQHLRGDGFTVSVNGHKANLMLDTGAGVSGTLGFILLHFLDVKLDYRDNLLDFACEDPWEKANKKK
jgi:hypothetical protein